MTDNDNDKSGKWGYIAVMVMVVSSNLMIVASIIWGK